MQTPVINTKKTASSQNFENAKHHQTESVPFTGTVILPQFTEDNSNISKNSNFPPSNTIMLLCINNAISHFNSTQNAVVAKLGDNKEISESNSSHEDGNADESANYGNYEQIKQELEQIKKEKADLQTQLNDAKITNKRLVNEVAQIRGILDNLVNTREKSSNRHYQLECDLKEANVRISNLISQLTRERQDKCNYIAAFKKILEKHVGVSAEEELSKEFKLMEPVGTERSLLTSRTFKSARISPQKEASVYNAEESVLAYVAKLESELQKKSQEIWVFM